MVESHDKLIVDTGSHMVGLRFALRNFGLQDIESVVMNSYYEEAPRHSESQ